MPRARLAVRLLHNNEQKLMTLAQRCWVECVLGGVDTSKLQAQVIEEYHGWLTTTTVTLSRVQEAQDLVTGRTLRRHYEEEQIKKLAKEAKLADIFQHHNYFLWDREKNALRMSNNHWETIEIAEFANEDDRPELMNVAWDTTRPKLALITFPMPVLADDHTRAFIAKYRQTSLNGELKTDIFLGNFEVETDEWPVMGPRFAIFRQPPAQDKPFFIIHPSFCLSSFLSLVSEELVSHTWVQKYQLVFFRGKNTKRRSFRDTLPIAVVQIIAHVARYQYTMYEAYKVRFRGSNPLERLLIILSLRNPRVRIRA